MSSQGEEGEDEDEEEALERVVVEVGRQIEGMMYS